jgi:hypothetical protein
MVKNKILPRNTCNYLNPGHFSLGVSNGKIPLKSLATSYLRFECVCNLNTHQLKSKLSLDEQKEDQEKWNI